MGGKNWFEKLGVSKNLGFKKSGVKLLCLTKANPREMCHGSKIEDSKNRDTTVLSLTLPYPSKTVKFQQTSIY